MYNNDNTDDQEFRKHGGGNGEEEERRREGRQHLGVRGQAAARVVGTSSPASPKEDPLFPFSVCHARSAGLRARRAAQRGLGFKRGEVICQQWKCSRHATSQQENIS